MDIGRYKHQTTSQRRVITIQEWAKYLGVSRHEVAVLLERYHETGHEYDAKDVYSVLDFYRYCLLSSAILKGLIA